MPKTKIQMSKITIILTLISIILPLTLMSQPTPSGRRLKEIVAEKYPEGNLLVGATTGAWALGTPTGIILKKEFSIVKYYLIGSLFMLKNNCFFCLFYL